MVAMTPINFEKEQVGTSLELTAKTSTDGKWISAEIIARHVRLLGLTKFEVGVRPSGERLNVEQPHFSTMKNILTLHVANGQRTLLGVHKMSGDDKTMEIFVLKLRTQKPSEIK